MLGSKQRVRKVLRGEMPDRAPLYDLLRNDAVLAHFGGAPLTPENAERVVFAAYAPALDAMRPRVRLPDAERSERLPDGREQRYYRWTTWTEHVHYPDSAAYEQAKRRQLAEYDSAWTPARQQALDETVRGWCETAARLGEVFFFPGAWSVGLMGLYGEVGLEAFSYYLADCPGIIDELLEMETVAAVQGIEHLPADCPFEAVFCGDDIAFKSGPLLSPTWFKEHYFARLGRVCAAYHRRGIKVLFHSDGNLMPILDDLVAAGIDGLNPIEVLAGMDVGEIHRRYPHLFMAGAIDVSQLLPLGTPQQVKDAVHRAIDAAEGRLMVGSSTELNNDVPLANYLALREAVLEHAY